LVEKKEKEGYTKEKEKESKSRRRRRKKRRKRKRKGKRKGKGKERERKGWRIWGRKRTFDDDGSAFPSEALIECLESQIVQTRNRTITEIELTYLWEDLGKRGGK